MWRARPYHSRPRALCFVSLRDDGVDVLLAFCWPLRSPPVLSPTCSHTAAAHRALSQDLMQGVNVAAAGQAQVSGAHEPQLAFGALVLAYSTCCSALFYFHLDCDCCLGLNCQRAFDDIRIVVGVGVFAE